MTHLERLLRDHAIQPSTQRLAVAEFVFHTGEHPSADQVWERAKKKFPALSRATVYNTLHLFVEKGLLRELSLSEGKQVFDPNVERHHHFIDEKSGAIRDVPWEALEVRHVELLKGFDVLDYQVVLRGHARSPRRR